MLVGKCMTKDPVTVSPNDSLALAAAKMDTGNFRRLPVVDDGRLVGILTLDDVRNHYDRLESEQVKSAMTAHPVTVSSSATLERATSLLSKHKIGGLPVVDGGKLVGIITKGDLLVPEPLSTQRTEEALVAEARRADKGEPVRLTGVVLEAMHGPGDASLDGPYDIPFQLSCVTSPEWEQEFLKAWDRLTGNGLSVMASVGSDRIVLNGTTIDDVERDLMGVLKRAVAEANRATAEATQKLRQRAKLEEQKRIERFRHIKEVVERLNFND